MEALGVRSQVSPHLAGKAVVDFARLRLADFEIEDNDGDPHLPLGAICDAEGRWVRENQALLVANHYMGTLEQVGAGVDLELLSNPLTCECPNPQLPSGDRGRTTRAGTAACRTCFFTKTRLSERTKSIPAAI